MNAKDLRIVFMGTPEFAVPSLRALVRSGYNVVGVVTTPDKPAGRGQKLHESDVKIAARELELPILQPENCAIRPSSVRWRSCGLTWES